MKLFVTGATGFIGSHFLRAAIDAGHEVVAVGRREPTLLHPLLRFVKSPIGPELASAPVPWEEIDVVVHLAASGVKASARLWPEALQVNVLGTQILLDLLERLGARRPPLIVATTFYQDFVGDNSALLENPYIATKRVATDLVRLWAERTQWPVCLARVFQVYGPGDNPSNVLPYALRQFANGEPALFGSGTSLRDWIYISDAVRAFMLLVDDLAASPPPGVSMFDIGSGQLASIKEMILTVAECCGVDAARICDFDPSRDRPDSLPNVAAQIAPSGFACEFVPRDGVRRLAESFGVSIL